MYLSPRLTAVKVCLRTGGIVFATLVAAHAEANSFAVAPDVSGGLGRYKWSIHIDANGAIGNPDLTLLTGQTYTFNISTTAIHPFWIDTAPGLGGASPYTGGGLSNNGIVGISTVTFTVPNDAPDTLYYACGNHGEMKGTINVIVDPIFKNDFEVPQV